MAHKVIKTNNIKPAYISSSNASYNTIRAQSIAINWPAQAIGAEKSTGVIAKSRAWQRCVIYGS